MNIGHASFDTCSIMLSLKRVSEYTSLWAQVIPKQLIILLWVHCVSSGWGREWPMFDCDLTVKLPPQARGEIWRGETRAADITCDGWWPEGTGGDLQLINWMSGHSDPGDGEYFGNICLENERVMMLKFSQNLREYWARRWSNTFINYRRSAGIKISPINTNLNFVRKTRVGTGFLTLQNTTWGSHKTTTGRQRGREL